MNRKKVVTLILALAAVAVLWWLLTRKTAPTLGDFTTAITGGKVKPDGTTPTTRPPQEPTAGTALTADDPAYVPGTLTGLPEPIAPVRSDFTPAELAATRESEYYAAESAPPQSFTEAAPAAE